ALYIRRRNPRVTLSEQINGGSQERGFRSGTLNVPGIVGFGKACSLFEEVGKEERERLAYLRDRLESCFLSESFTFVNGQKAIRLPNVSNIAFEGVDAQRLINELNYEIALSLGSACTSAVEGPSHVLLAMGLCEERIKGAFR